MRNKVIFPFFLLSVAFAVSAGPDDLNKCLRFKAPDQKSVITTPACTLGVDSSCKQIETVEIRARYSPYGSDTLIEKNIGTLFSPPFIKVWDLSGIPDQLTIGVGVLIIVNFSDGDAFGLHREGIFLAHQPLSYPLTQHIMYEYAGTKEFHADTIRFNPLNAGVNAFARMYWNEKDITAMVSVRDTTLDTSASQKVLEQTGIEILIDPAKKQRPYPTDDIMRFFVPLAGKPYRITYQPIFNDGRIYQLKQATVPGNFDYSVRTSDHGGFIVVFSIPRYLFGKSLPREMGYNIIVRVSSGKTSSLVNAGNGFNHYSPLLWPSLTLLPKPLFKARWLILLVSFFAGFLISLLAYGIYFALTKNKPRVILIRGKEAEKHAFEKMKEALDKHILRKEMSPAEIASELNMSPKQLEATIKKTTGLSFRNYAMYLRTEIVCERLRSSYSSETTVAESCGFLNTKEMERYFKRFQHMTPQNFRKMSQITHQAQ
jgi:AraC-like DNA-binding protein